MKLGWFWAVVFLSCHVVVLAQQFDSPTDSTQVATELESSDGVEDGHRLVPPDELESTREYQAEPMRLRDFDEDKWKSIVGNTNFLENSQKKTRQKKSQPWSGGLLRLISYTIIIGVVLLLVYYVVQYISFAPKIQRSKMEIEDIEKPVEDIAVLDTRQLLEQAIREGNYKLAVRLYYLELLKQLHAKGAIAWKKDKTNRDYLTELLSANFFFDEIRRLTRSYEAVWYGDHTLQRDSFQILSGHFEMMYLKINAGDNK